MGRKFQKRVEDFLCEHCGAYVKGTGYTNHCPHCLWSKHVDVYPGDRAHPCRGMMEPIAVEMKGGAWVIVHRCVKCGEIRRNRAAQEDDFEMLLRVAQQSAQRKMHR